MAVETRLPATPGSPRAGLPPFLAMTVNLPFHSVSEVKRVSIGREETGLVGAIGFEPTTPCTPSKCATRLRYAPTLKGWGILSASERECQGGGNVSVAGGGGRWSP